MITYLISRDYKKSDGRTYNFAEFTVDSVDELPDVDEALDGKYLVAGSIALVIATGDFYVLNSAGEWVNQTGEEDAVSGNRTANSSSLTSGLTKNTLLNSFNSETLDEATNKTTETLESEDRPSELDEFVKSESVIKDDEKDGEADVLGDTESK